MKIENEIRYDNLSGRQFGSLLVHSKSDDPNCVSWKCQCSICNKILILKPHILKKRVSEDCFCIYYKDLTGEKIGSLSIIKASDNYFSIKQINVNV